MAETSEPLFDIGANLLDSQLFKNIDSIVLKSIENNIRKIVITSSHIDDTYEAKVNKKQPDLYIQQWVSILTMPKTLVIVI